ncbi:MAG: YhdP family protein [Betaproteobacteria bacterium]
MRIFLKRTLLALEMLAWTAFFAFALTFLALRYWVLPNIEGQRERIVAAISQAVGLPVTIGALETDWAGLRPRLSISDVRVYDRGGREALVLPVVENVVSWRSLMFMDLRLHSFLIDGPKLEVRRDTRGAITVGGIEITAGGDEGRLSDWVLAQSEIIIRGAEVTWTDESRGAPPLALTALHFRLTNDGDQHALGLSARPPRHLGPGVELRAELVGRSVKQLAQWNGRVYAELGATDLAGWRAWVDYPLDVRSGEGALRLWATLGEGKPLRATADVALAGVVARMGKDLPPLEVSSVRGRLQGRAVGGGYEFGMRNLVLESPRSAPMKATGFRVRWEPAAGAQPQKGSLDANLVELGPLVQLAEYLPLPADLRQVLAELAPQGNLLDAKLDWTGELPDKAAYTAKMRFAGLAVNAWRSIPGFAGLSGNLEASEKKGVLYLASQKSELDLPTIFPEPRIQLDSLSGEVAWELESGGAFAVRVPSLSFANADLAGSAFGNYHWTGEGPGTLDLSAQLSRADGKRTAKYLPLSSIMGPSTRGWLETAIVAGNVKDARLRLKGDLRDFPFTDPAKGQFQIAAKVGAGVLDYVQGWPRIDHIEADLLFERERMEIVGRSGAILGARVGTTRVSIANLLSPDPRLVVDGAAEGPTADFLKYVQGSGVRRMLGGITDGMVAQGRGRLRLRLELPLNDLAKTRTTGEFQVANNTLVLDARVPPIAAATGRIAFTEDSLSVNDLRGTLFGGPVAISGGSKAGVPMTIVARGRGTVEGFAALFDHPWRKRLVGGAAYVATVSSLEGRVRTTLETSLEGVASALPEPLAKLPGVALPLRVDVLPGEGRERVVLTLGPPAGRMLVAEFLRAAAAPGGALQTQRALVMLNPAPGEAPVVPERRGFTIRGALPALDLDKWLPLLKQTSGEGSAAGEGGASFELKVGVLDALGKRMRNVSMKGLTEGEGWSASMDTTEFSGDLLYRAEAGGRLVGRFKHFSLPESSPGAKEGGDAARELPAVDLVAESFTHRGRRMGRVEIAARHEGRDWRIDKLAMVTPDSALAGKGLWRMGPALRTSLADASASRTSIEFKLDVTDVAAFLARMGYPDHVKGGRGRVQGRLDWTGDPVSLDYATMGGQLDMQVDDGQFLEIEPGIGKLVSLMSLQMLPRRITMDFRDVFSKGFQFDRISSSLAIERGVMTTKDFRMRGPAAEVSMSGLVDLNLEAQNLQVRVIPRVDGVVSTVVGLINPVAGVATMIAQKLFKDPLGQLAAYEYNITGTWTDPKVEKAEPASAAAPPVDREATVPGN